MIRVVQGSYFVKYCKFVRSMFTTTTSQLQYPSDFYDLNCITSH